MKYITMDDAGYWGVAPDTQYGRALTASSARGGLECAAYVLGDPNDTDVPIGVLVHYPANWEFPRHSHRSARMEVIVTGSIIIDGRVLGPGSIMTADKDEMYGPHSVGPQGCVTVEIMDGQGARGLTVPTPEGNLFVDFENPEFMRALDEVLPNP